MKKYILLAIILIISFISTFIYQLPISESIQEIISFPIYFTIAISVSVTIGIYSVFQHLVTYGYPIEIFAMIIISFSITGFSIRYWIKNKHKRRSKYVLGIGILFWILLGVAGMAMMY